MAQPLPALDYDELEAELCRRSLPDFIAKTWPLIEPDTPLSWNWHLEELCSVLEAVTRGEIKRVIINIPPGTGKSIICTLWSAWEWATNAGLRYLTASYGAHLTIRDNLRLRAVVTSPWYQRHFSLRLSGDQNSKVRFDTTALGWRIASSVGGVGTGEHPDRIVIDDPLTATQARSALERESANTWVDRTISTRGVTRDARLVVIMQRLHEEDTTAHLLSKGGYEHVVFPMHYDPARADKRDRRSEPGALLWPSLFTEEKVRTLEIDLGPFGSAGQLEQRPSPEGGGLFKREWFKRVAVAPVVARRCRGWDTAATDGAGDWTAGVRLAVAPDGRIYVEHVARGRKGPAGVDALMKDTATADGRAVIIRELREPAAAGKSVIAARLKLLQGYDYAEWPAGGDKVTAAGPFRAQCEGGNVHIVTGPDDQQHPEWVEPFLQVLEAFPTGAYDDDVDGASCAYNALVAEPPRGMTVVKRY